MIDDPEDASPTREAARWVADLRFDRIPSEVIELGRKSMLDGLGLAIAGSRAEGSRLLRAELADLGCTRADASVLGTALRLPARFAAFLNGAAIHADDYDDTQLAVAPD